MKTQPTIMVQLADRLWTEEAVHAACQLARASGAEVTLLSMARVQQIGLLGTPLGDRKFPREEQTNLLSYLQIIAQAGVPCTVKRFQYISIGGAIAEAAEWVDADVVFASLPHRILPLQRRLELANLRRALARQGRKLIDFQCRTPLVARLVIDVASPIG
ncbi:MAG: universal stress protein [Anaerolineales bacterium]|nr:universal stress protein [Anaerolineales bacterium]